jgi:Protein of unknown function (DUF3313)
MEFVMSKNFLLAYPPITASALGAVMALSLLLASGCASVDAPQQSRTLSAFEQLQAQPDGSRAWRSAEISRYEAVRIDPAAIVFGAEVQLDEEQREKLRLALASALTDRFASLGLPTVKGADGRRTAALRATFTVVELTNPALNVATTLLLFAPVSRGGVTVEIEAVDGSSSQRVAAMAVTGKAGLENVKSAYSSIGHAKLQTEVAAERFAAFFTGKTAATPPGKANQTVAPDTYSQ